MPTPTETPTDRTRTIAFDAVILGGGMAGLWTLDRLSRDGRRCLLLEPHALGAGQSVCAQGIIHGGLKYTLNRAAGGAATGDQPIRMMPCLWRDCLAGRVHPDLTAAPLLSDACWLWQTRSIRSRVGMVGARANLAVQPRVVESGERPAVLRSCPGVVAELPEPVVDPVSILRVLATQYRDFILRIDPDRGLTVRSCDEDGVTLDLLAPASHGTTHPSSPTLRVATRCVILTAGAGNETLAEAFNLPHNAMQRRPLHMVMVRGSGDAALPHLYGHCVDGARTRVTVTTHADHVGRTVWQVGGQIAEDGVNMAPSRLIEHARRELQDVLPDFDVNKTGIDWATYRIDRAEARQPGKGRRPEDVAITRHGCVLLAWPTKLALAPRLADRIADSLAHVAQYPLPHESTAAVPDDWPRPDVADPPWENAQWS